MVLHSTPGPCGSVRQSRVTMYQTAKKEDLTAVPQENLTIPRGQITEMLTCPEAFDLRSTPAGARVAIACLL